MARRSGLGKGLGALIPTDEPADVDGDDRTSQEIPVGAIEPNPHQPRAALRRGVPGRAGRLDPRDRRAAAGAGAARPATASFELIAGERRWRAAKRAGLPTIPAIVRDGRRPRLARAGAGREPPPPGPDAARGGGGLPAADRGLRPHPRAGGQPGRQEPLGGHQHPAAASSCRPSVQQLLAERQAQRRPRPGAARHARPRLPGDSWPAGRSAEELSVRELEEAGPRARGGADQRAEPGTTGDGAGRPATPLRPARSARARGAARRATSTPGSACRWGPSGARS